MIFVPQLRQRPRPVLRLLLLVCFLQVLAQSLELFEYEQRGRHIHVVLVPKHAQQLSLMRTVQVALSEHTRECKEHGEADRPLCHHVVACALARA